MSYKVAILGDGVGGLSAAHELIERGFAVSVFERSNVLGGKARSIYVPNSGTGGRIDLPGEHGFRFFPAFYKHLPDTMMRIPFPANVSVFNNLVHTTRIEVAQAGKQPLMLTGRLPQDMGDWLLAFKDLFGGIGVPDNEVLFFADRLLTLLTSCPERRCRSMSRYRGGPLSTLRTTRTAIRRCWQRGLRGLLSQSEHRRAAHAQPGISFCN